MNRIISRLASFSLAFYLMGALVLWLFLGIFLARCPATDPAIHQMNQKLILDWLFDAETMDWRVVGWFLGFCLLNLFLFVNLAACTATSSWNRMFFNNDKTKKRLLFVIHGLIALIMIGHLANMGIGYKYSWIKMAPGDSFALPNGAALTVSDVNYAVPVKFLKMDRHEARKQLGREIFDIKENYVSVRLTRYNREIAKGNLYMLKPLRVGPLRVTLNRFFLLENKGENAVGAILTVSKNPIHEAFFLIYALTIVCLLIYLITCKQASPLSPQKNGGINLNQ